MTTLDQCTSRFSPARESVKSTGPTQPIRRDGRAVTTAPRSDRNTLRPSTLEQLTDQLLGEAIPNRGRALVQIIVSAALANALVGQCNLGNRPVRPNMRLQFATAMNEDRWGDSNLIFGVIDGSVQIGDGQHRLMAQADTGTTQNYAAWVYTDADEFKAAVRRVDSRGSARSVADLLVINGNLSQQKARTAETVANFMMQFDGTVQPRRAPDLESRFAYCETRVPGLEFAIASTAKQVGFKPWARAAIAFAYGKERKATTEFVERIVSKENLRAGMPEHTFLKQQDKLMAAKSPADKRRACAVVLRLIHESAIGSRTTRTNVRVDSDETMAAVERFAGKRAAAQLKADHKRA